MLQGFALVRRAVAVMTGLLALLAAIGLLGLIVITIINVVRRIATGGGFENMVGFGEVGVAAIALLGVAHAQRRGAHIRSTVVLDRIPGKARDICELVWRVVVFALVVWLAQATWDRAGMSVDIGESRFGTVPIWPSRIAIAASVVLLGLQFLVEIVERALIVLGARNSQLPNDSGQEALEVTL